MSEYLSDDDEIIYTNDDLELHDLESKLTEEELLELFKKAKGLKLKAHIITDAGRTEFNGVPTKTALAIGPNKANEIDKITGNDFLQFTAELWGADRDDNTLSNKVDVISKDVFPFLDMELYWRNNLLQFQIHLKLIE